MNTKIAAVGTVLSVRRYPVKSMQGEAINGVEMTERGVLGDRAYALMDRTTGHIASAKYPRKWGQLLECHARFVEPPQLNKSLPPVWITLPNGEVVCSDQPDIDQILSNLLGRDVTLLAEAPVNPTREADRTPLDGSSTEEKIRQEAVAFAAPTGTFFDYSPIHLLTTATINCLKDRFPSGQFEMRRFRPNIVIQTPDAERDFVENQWLGHRATIGIKAQLHIIDPCPRCVMTTLPQEDLPRDIGILQTIAHHNQVESFTLAPGRILPAIAGVYAAVVGEGRICRGDAISLQQESP
ncbi:MAG TPA: MOSC N-terminal beta barrel domain-containing protein [Coleofasciculaceae cyanobacterium]